ncbi:hypothetical protein LguiA_002090 [Lonicera macranthoides]
MSTSGEMNSGSSVKRILIPPARMMLFRRDWLLVTTAIFSGCVYVASWHLLECSNRSSLFE